MIPLYHQIICDAGMIEQWHLHLHIMPVQSGVIGLIHLQVMSCMHGLMQSSRKLLCLQYSSSKIVHANHGHG